MGLKILFKFRYCFHWIMIIVAFVFIDIIVRKHYANVKMYSTFTQNPELRAEHLKDIIYKRNTAHEIQNSDIYSQVRENTIIFVVHMDKHSKSLTPLLVSLSDVEGIADALLIFSHSYYDEKVNKIIGQIDFCRVLQIFYPYSLQIYPVTFPGKDPRDCPTHIDEEDANATHCRGTRDFRGRYRDPELAEKKHHWWWTCNTIFEDLMLTNKDSGLVVFLELDYTLTKDFIYMALYMKNVAQAQPQCEFLSMGRESISPPGWDDYFYAAELATLNHSFYSHILAFDLNTWNIIVSHYDMFCSVDESSWFGSLIYISVNRKHGTQFKVMSSVVPRAYKIMPSILNSLRKRSGIDYWWDEDEGFPSHIELYINLETDDDTDAIFDYRDSLGCWADPRDKQLCNMLTKMKMKKVLMEMEHKDTNSFRNNLILT